MDALRLVFVQVFNVLGIVTKYCDKAADANAKAIGKKGARAMLQRISELNVYLVMTLADAVLEEDYSRVFLGETDVEEALKELEELTEEEELMAGAVTNAVVRDTNTVVHDGEPFSIHLYSGDLTFVVKSEVVVVKLKVDDLHNKAGT